MEKKTTHPMRACLGCVLTFEDPGANLSHPQGDSVVRGPSSRVGPSRGGGWDVQSARK